MATEKDVAITGTISGGGSYDARLIADLIVQSIGNTKLSGGGAAGGGGGVTNVNVTQNVVNEAGGARSVEGTQDALIRALDNARAGMDLMTVAMRQQAEAMSRQNRKEAESGENSRQARADAERREKAEQKSQKKAADATTKAMRDMQTAAGGRQATAAAMDKRIQSQRTDIGEWQKRLAAAGAAQPASLTALTQRMGIYRNPHTTQAKKAEAYQYVQDNLKQARYDTNRAIATGKRLQAQQKQIDAASKQADELLKNPLLDKSSEAYQRLESAKGYMDQSANWGKNQASNYGLRKGALQGLTQANEDAGKAAKAAETAAKNAEAQYKLLTGNERFKSLSGKQQMDLGEAFKNFQKDRSAENLRALQAEEKSAQNVLGLQERIAKSNGAAMEQRAAQERMDAVSGRAGGYDKWSDQQKKWYDDATKYQNDLNTALRKGDLKTAGDSLGLMNKALNNLNPSLAKSEKTINAANKAQDKAVDLATTPMSGSARNALNAASQQLDTALKGNDMQAVADATKNVMNALDVAQKSAASITERAKATEKQQAALEKNAYTPAQNKAAMQAAREAWEQSRDTKDLGRYVASVKNAQWGSMANEVAGLNKQLDLMRNPTGAHDNSAEWATAQKQRLDEVTAAYERYNQAVAKKDVTGAASAMQDMKTGMGALKTELSEAEKIQKEIDRVRNSANYGRLSEGMKKSLADAETAWKTSGIDDYQRKVNGVFDTIKQMDSAMANMKTADQWNRASNEVDKYTQKLNRVSAGNGGSANWTKYQSGLYADASQELANMKAAQQAGDVGAYDAAQKAFNGKINALNASLMTTRGYMGGITGQVDALSKTLANLAAPMMMWRRFTGYLKKAANNVSAIDSQMADLRKVTNNTNAEYQQFLTSSGQNAVAIGAKISDLVATTSTFAHMGYSLTDSQALGVTATKFANVGNFQNTTEAADAMIAVIKGFDDLSIGDADIVGDKLTAVANNYAVTANDIAQGLQKSASSLNVAGNNIDQSTAMITAIAEVTRDAGAAGSALKVLSMRIRGAKTE